MNLPASLELAMAGRPARHAPEVKPMADGPAHGKGVLFFKLETSSPPGAEASPAFGGRGALCAFFVGITCMATAQRVRRPPCRRASSAAVPSA
jgi:hypothetical protein